MGYFCSMSSIRDSAEIPHRVKAPCRGYKLCNSSLVVRKYVGGKSLNEIDFFKCMFCLILETSIRHFPLLSFNFMDLESSITHIFRLLEKGQRWILKKLSCLASGDGRHRFFIVRKLNVN